MSLILSGTDGLSDVDGTVSTPAIRGTDANTGIFFPAADTIAFSEGGVESMRIDSSGNVGIGTSSPAQKLHVASASSTYIQVQNTGNSVNAYYGVDTGGGWMGTSTNHYAAFYTNNTERMRITSGGNLLVGTTTATGNTSNSAVIFAGAFRTQSASTSIASTGVATTVLTFNNNDGDFIVSMRASGTGAPTTDDAVAIICVNGGSASQTNLKTATNVVISLSGLNLQVTQNLFAGANINWSVMRISS